MPVWRAAEERVCTGVCRLGYSTLLVHTHNGLSLSDDYSDDALSAHESELDKMKGFFEDHKDIFKLIDKREEMWSKMLQFEVCCDLLAVMSFCLNADEMIMVLVLIYW